MSGIAGIAYLDGKPPSRELLLQIARSLSFRGPDGQRVWSDSAAGLVHAAHLIKGDCARAQGPESIGTGTWITADIRLDAREELIAGLRTLRQEADRSCSDSRLLLHAYEAWGEKCVHHVAGEFAFAIWDARRRQLFCACDQFGIRQLYFSNLQSCLIFSNTLECVRLFPDVSDSLNDAAIADFLLFGINYDENATSFSNIRRLPRAHWLRCSTEGIEIREYWRPPTDVKIRYKKNREYVEHFTEIFRKAVADRIPGDSAGVLLSGGIDSSSVAAICKETEAQEGRPQIHAFTVSCEGTNERDPTEGQTVAEALGIPFHLLKAGNEKPFQGWSAGDVHFPEPLQDAFAGEIVQQSREIAEYSGVVLSGEGSDNLMNCEPGHHLRQTWRQGRRKQAAIDAVEHVVARFRAPDGLLGPMRRFRSLSIHRSAPQFPPWISAELTQRLNLKERWINHDAAIPWNVHLEHPGGYASLFFPQWRSMFECLDSAYTRTALDVRYPFLDLRIVEYLLAIPAMPWFFRKFLLREAMRGRLPEKIRKRAKIPPKELSPLNMTADYSKERLVPELELYVNKEVLEQANRSANPEVAEMSIRPWCLNLWLENLGMVKLAPTGAFASAP